MCMRVSVVCPCVRIYVRTRAKKCTCDNAYVCTCVCAYALTFAQVKVLTARSRRTIRQFVRLVTTQSSKCCTTGTGTRRQTHHERQTVLAPLPSSIEKKVLRFSGRCPPQSAAVLGPQPDNGPIAPTTDDRGCRAPSSASRSDSTAHRSLPSQGPPALESLPDKLRTSHRQRSGLPARALRFLFRCPTTRAAMPSDFVTR